MAVYVDWLQPTIPSKNWRYSQGCHLMADTEAELHEFAIDVLGLKRHWFHNHPRHPHYDLTPNKRKTAVKNGAISVGLDWYKQKRKLRKAVNNA